VSVSEVECVVSEGQLFRELLKFSLEVLILEADKWGRETVREPRGRTSAIKSRYQATVCEDTAGWEDLNICSSDL
jgi:hypothetical protein